MYKCVELTFKSIWTYSCKNTTLIVKVQVTLTSFSNHFIFKYSPEFRGITRYYKSLHVISINFIDINVARSYDYLQIIAQLNSYQQSTSICSKKIYYYCFEIFERN